MNCVLWGCVLCGACAPLSTLTSRVVSRAAEGSRVKHRMTVWYLCDTRYKCDPIKFVLRHTERATEDRSIRFKYRSIVFLFDLFYSRT